MKSNKPIQILTVIFALGLLAAYVVYSQGRQTSQTVMPGSKSRVIDGEKQQWTLAAKPGTNIVTNQTSSSVPSKMTVMSSSKVLVPVVSNPPAKPGPVSFSNDSRTVIGGSKFATVFTPAPAPAPATSTNPSKAVIYGSKSAPAFVPDSKPSASATSPTNTNASKK